MCTLNCNKNALYYYPRLLALHELDQADGTIGLFDEETGAWNLPDMLSLSSKSLT